MLAWAHWYFLNIVTFFYQKAIYLSYLFTSWFAKDTTKIQLIISVSHNPTILVYLDSNSPYYWSSQCFNKPISFLQIKVIHFPSQFSPQLACILVHSFQAWLLRKKHPCSTLHSNLLLHFLKPGCNILFFSALLFSHKFLALCMH